MLKNILKITLILTIFTALAYSMVEISKGATQRTIDNIYFSNFDNVLSIQTSDGQTGVRATGVVVTGKSGKLIVLTNKHVCIGARSPVWLMNDTIAIKAEVLFQHPTVDLCVIDFPTDVKMNTPDIAASEPRMNEEVYSFGYPLDLYKNILAGRIIIDQTFNFVDVHTDQTNCLHTRTIKGVEYCHTQEIYLQTNILQFHGNSGSPVFNKNNELVGLTVATHTQTNFGSIIHLTDIKLVLSKY